MVEAKPESDENLDEDNDENNDEDEVIDVSEKIFIRIAEQIIMKEIPTVHEVFKDQLRDVNIAGEYVKVLTPEGLLEALQTSLGITDLTEKEIEYLLRVMTKPEIDGMIVY